MLTGLVILFSLAWCYFFYRWRDVFSPWSLTLLVWVAIIFMYLTIDHGLYKATDQFSYAVLLWVSLFTLSSYVTCRLVPSNIGGEWKANPKVLNFFTALSVIIAPYMLYKAVGFALQNGSADNLMYTLRDQVTDEDSGFSLGPIAYYIHVVYVMLFVIADEKGKTKRAYFIFAMLMCFVFFFVQMSKIILFVCLLSTLYLFYANGKIRLRTIVLTMSAFAFLGILFTQLRTSDDGDTEKTFTLMDLFSIYIVSPIVAFSYEVPNISEYWGYETFRPLYNIFHAMGFTQVTPFNALAKDFVFVPFPTNVYTMMCPMFHDFGYWGIGGFAAVEGVIMGYVYKKANTGNTILRCLYAYFVAIIVLQFFDEQFFSGISNIIQILLLIILFHIKIVWKTDKPYFFRRIK